MSDFGNFFRTGWENVCKLNGCPSLNYLSKWAL